MTKQELKLQYMGGKISTKEYFIELSRILRNSFVPVKKLAENCVPKPSMSIFEIFDGSVM